MEVSTSANCQRVLLLAIIDSRRHLDRDFEPYVCISEKCSEHLRSFTTFQDWQHHMLNQHGPHWPQESHPPSSWLCAVCLDVPDGFRDPPALSQHMQDVHRFEEAAIKAIVRQSKFQVRRRPEICPICCLRVEEEGDSKFVKASRATPVVIDPRKRHQGPLVQLGPLKRARTSEDMEASDSGQNSSSRLEIGDQEPGPENPVADVEMPDTDMMARHVATHLQNLAFLSTNLITIRDYGEDDVESVTTQSPSDDNSHAGTDFTQKLSSRGGVSSDTSEHISSTATSPIEQVFAMEESQDVRHHTTHPPDTDANVDWSRIISSTKKVAPDSEMPLLGLTHYDEFDLFLIKYRHPNLATAVQKHLARSVQIRRQKLSRQAQASHTNTAIPPRPHVHRRTAIPPRPFFNPREVDEGFMRKLISGNPNRSYSSSVISTSPLSALDYPKPPQPLLRDLQLEDFQRGKGDQQGVVCPYCQLFVPRETTMKPSLWRLVLCVEDLRETITNVTRKHINKDLATLVCVYTSCLQ
jgi:hypothetical protein